MNSFQQPDKLECNSIKNLSKFCSFVSRTSFNNRYTSKVKVVSYHWYFCIFCVSIDHRMVHSGGSIGTLDVDCRTHGRIKRVLGFLMHKKPKFLPFQSKLGLKAVSSSPQFFGRCPRTLAKHLTCPPPNLKNWSPGYALFP